MTSTTATSGSTTTGTTTSSTGTSTTGGQAGNGGSTGTGSSMNDASSAGGSGGSPGMEAGKEGSADGRGNWTVGDPGIEGDGDVTLEPNPPEHPDIATKNVPHGKSFQFTMSSADSQIYKGDDATLQSRRAFTRRVTVYVPSQYVDGT
ncbi:MAG TPA: hypothetical protein VJT73_14785, partial [Polyangiaceae bacterium]|nr:hypothetical protein [Polyangiaceae bacterium]